MIIRVLTEEILRYNRPHSHLCGYVVLVLVVADTEKTQCSGKEVDSTTGSYERKRLRGMV